MDDREARSSRRLGAEMEPLARRLADFASPLVGDEALPPVQRLAPLAAGIALSVAYALLTSGDPNLCRRNLRTLHQQATELARATEAALREPGT